MLIKRTALALAALLSMGTAAQAASLSTPAMLVRATDTVSCVVVNKGTSAIDISWQSHWPIDRDPCDSLPMCLGPALAAGMVDPGAARILADTGVPGAGVYRCTIDGRFAKKKVQLTMQVWSGGVLTGSTITE